MQKFAMNFLSIICNNKKRALKIEVITYNQFISENKSTNVNKNICFWIELTFFYKNIYLNKF